MHAFWEGAIAGYGIAIPVGAIAVLLVDLAMRRGFVRAAAAGAGVATADLVYALVAVLLGAAVADALEPHQDTLRIVSAVVLLGVAAYLLRGALRRRATGDAPSVSNAGAFGTYVRFLGLTILNPATITYFVALILGLDRTREELRPVFESSATKRLTSIARTSANCMDPRAGMTCFRSSVRYPEIVWGFSAGSVASSQSSAQSLNSLRPSDGSRYVPSLTLTSILLAKRRASASVRNVRLRSTRSGSR